MGVVWEAYHKGVLLLGVPENPIECSRADLCRFQVIFVGHKFVPSKLLLAETRV